MIIRRNIDFSILDRAVHIIDEQTSSEQHTTRFNPRPMHTIHEHCGVLLCTPTNNPHSHPDCDRPKRLAKGDWLLLYPAAVVHDAPVCTLCTTPAVGLLSKSGCPAHCVGPSFFVRVIRWQIISGNKTTTAVPGIL